MIPDELSKIINQLSLQGEMAYIDHATEEQILKFEKKHSITFPEQYKMWLLFSDGGELFLPAGIQFYGVAHKPFIDVNDDDRPSDNYIVIGTLASGDPILCENGKEKISIYNHEAGRIEEDEIYDNFYSFLRDIDGILGIGG